jgi:hypothetical protein
MNDSKIKQQVVEKIQNSSNILVTVSNDPSVDALSAALALTLILNKLSKHTTAIFSGAVPPAITFLDPEKTFESTTDSLRDFIIAIDKEKADHLRYKVDGDVVKIFITPYKTKIGQEDLEFSQGDYNIELVLALGVENQAHLDAALEAHGRILHDATVVTISSGTQTSSLGSIDWQDDTASSLCEMLVSLVESIQGDGALVDQEVATAILTGIVAQTDRFSNTRTTSRVMTIAAQLMSAGADQQLIASKLQESHTIGNVNVTAPSGAVEQPNDSMTTGDGFSIDHSIDEPPKAELANVQTQTVDNNVGETTVVPIQPEVSVSSSGEKIADAYAIGPDDSDVQTVEAPVVAQPALGGVPQPTEPVPTPVEEPKPAEEDEGEGHSYLTDAPSFSAPINGIAQPDAPADADVFAGHDSGNESAPLSNPDIIVPPVEAAPSYQGDELASVNASYAPAEQPSFNPAPGIALPMPPPVPDFGALPQITINPAYAVDPIAQPPEILGDILAPEQTVSAPPLQPQSTDPGQFRIPGQ